MTPKDVLIQDFQTIDPNLLSSFKNKIVVITGATGFLGSLLTRFFIWANKQYSLSTKLILIVRNPRKLRKLLGDSINSNNILVKIIDFTSQAEPLDEPFSYLIHTAAITASSVMVKHPVEVADVALNGIKWALESSRKYDNSRVLFLSSMEVYGSFANEKRVTEGDLGQIDLSSVRSCYPESKRMSELLCTLYNKQYGTDSLIARLAQTFGAGILPSENRVFKQFADSVIEDKPIVLHTDGKSDGNYVYSSDAIAAILRLLVSGKRGEAYNVANEQCHTTIRDMAQMVVNTFGGPKVKLVIENKDALTFGYAAPTKMTLSADKLKSLGWSPKVNLPQAYERLISYMRATD